MAINVVAGINVEDGPFLGENKCGGVILSVEGQKFSEE